MKLIDADALLSGIYSDNPSDIMLYVASQPEAIVRCKDCKYNANSTERGNALCNNFYGMTDQYGFCHFGERKKNEPKQENNNSR